jgi:hypothetical protein
MKAVKFLLIVFCALSLYAFGAADPSFSQDASTGSTSMTDGAGDSARRSMTAQSSASSGNGEITAAFDNADFDFPVVMSGGEWRVTGDRHLKSTATLTAVFKDGAGRVLTPGAVVWSAEIVRNPAAPWWLKSSASLSGLTWADTTASGWDSYWSADSAEGTPPTGDVAELTDVVGGRKVKVTAATVIGGVTYEVSEVITFGDGPLSVFTKAPQTGKKWAEQNGVAGRTSLWGIGVFTDSANSFPAANYCMGTVDNSSGVISVSGSDPNFSLSVSPSSDWRAGDHWSGHYYSTSSGLPTLGQLVAVSRYDGGYNSVVHRKGAALAAGWPDDAASEGLYGYWTGQVNFYSDGSFVADVVFLADGHDGGLAGLASAEPVTVCVAP